MSFKVKCSKCGNVIEVDDFIGSDFEVSESDERDMGPDNTHEANKEVYCDKCSNDIVITVDISEYPVGCFQEPEIEIKKGSFLPDLSLDKCIDELKAKSLGV